MTDETSHTPPAYAEHFERRARRGRSRGADAVLADARLGSTDPSGDGSPGAAWRIGITAAAALLLIGGVAVALASRDTTAPVDSTDGGVASALVEQLCASAAMPAGAVTGDPEPIACAAQTRPGGAARTSTSTPSGWVDPFQIDLGTDPAGPSAVVPLADDYRFEVLGRLESVTGGRTRAGWIVDVVPGDLAVESTGGAMFRPEATFGFVDGELQVEAELLLGHQDFDATGWYEIVITTADRFPGFRGDGLYATDAFPDHHTLGCRFEPGGNTVCALMDDTDRGSTAGGRLWEAGPAGGPGGERFGGFAQPELGLEYQGCSPAATLTDCLDRIRLTITEDAIRVDLNGRRYFEQVGLPSLPTALLEGDVSVYIAAMTSREASPLRRFHGRALSINAR